MRNGTAVMAFKGLLRRLNMQEPEVFKELYWFCQNSDKGMLPKHLLILQRYNLMADNEIRPEVIRIVKDETIQKEDGQLEI